MKLMWDAHFYYFKECVVVRFSDKRAWEKKSSMLRIRKE